MFHTIDVQIEGEEIVVEPEQNSKSYSTRLALECNLT